MNKLSTRASIAKGEQDLWKLPPPLKVKDSHSQRTPTILLLIDVDMTCHQDGAESVVVGM